MAFHLCQSGHHRGPLIIIAVGVGFALVGAIPVAVNFSYGETNSGTIIGVGFIGFGLLLIIPGLFWFILQRLMGLKKLCGGCCCSSSGGWHRESVDDVQETTPALEIVRKSKSSTVGDDASSSVSAHNDCTFDEDDNRNSIDDIDTIIVIPPPQRPDPTR